MKKLTPAEIHAINKKSPYNQGVFVQPYGIPIHIKGPVIYSKNLVSGSHGGNYNGGVAEPFTVPLPKNYLRVLDFVLEAVEPNINYIHAKHITEDFKDNTETKYEYYGNCSDYYILYLELEELYEKLNFYGYGGEPENLPHECLQKDFELVPGFRCRGFNACKKCINTLKYHP